MAAEQDRWLPEPPPPRLARRDEAIAAALRRFDGVEEAAAAATPPRRSWASAHRPQLAVAVSAMLILVIGLPAALIGLRTAPSSEGHAPAAAVTHERFAPAPPAAPPTQEAARSAEAPPSNPPLAAAAPPRKDEGAEARQVASNEPAPAEALAAKPTAPAAPAAPAPELAAAAPPPPPPPLPPPPAAERDEVASAEKAADQAAARDIVITGARSAAPMASAAPYRPFLSRLQAALRANDRRAVVRLIAFPLRVNEPGGPKFYRDPRSVERDFDRIFTPKVRRAVLAQRPDQLFVRDQGAMIGDGEVWFDQTCANASCSMLDPVRIKAVNP